MPKKELINFLKYAQMLKLNLETLGRELVKAGWSISDVNEALEMVKPLKVPKAPLKVPTPPQMLSEAERKALEHIKKLKNSGLSNEQIKDAFIAKGWKAEVIDKLLEEARK